MINEMYIIRVVYCEGTTTTTWVYPEYFDTEKKAVAFTQEHLGSRTFPSPDFQDRKVFMRVSDYARITTLYFIEPLYARECIPETVDTSLTVDSLTMEKNNASSEKK
jgi:hypothetical protein